MRKRLLKRFRKVIYGSLLGLAISSLAQAQPMISSFSPGSGPVSTTVTIVGTGFNATASQNIVFFGSTQAAVQASSGGTSLTVIAPYGADYRCISVANLGTNLVGYSAIPFVATYTPVGDNTFRPKVELTSGLGANARFVAFSDVNNDGKPDLLVANSDNTISIFPNQVTSITGTAMFGSAVTLGTSSGAFSSALSVGDFDGDGKLDIAAVFSGAASAFLYRNTTSSSGATPTFAAGVTVTVATNPDAVSVGDFDADGLVDIVVTSDLATNNLTVLRNTGNFIFVPVATVSVGTNPDAVVVGDFDQDGKSDLAVANHGSNNVSVLRNASTMVGVINWDSPVTLSAGTAPSSIVVGDMDGDTLLDIGVSNLGSNTISTFLNSSTSGTISFGTNVDFSTGASPTSVAMGDTNGDGLSDIVLANLGDNTVSILQNTSSVGSIAFATSSDVSNASITSPSAIVVDDINQDGKPDLLLATGGTSNNVAVFLQRIAQTLTITSPNVVVVDGTLTATLTSTATSGGGTLTYSMLNNTGSAIVDPVTGVVTAVSAGNVILILTSSGDTDYATAATSQTITIGQATPTLTITSANEVVFDTTMTALVNTTASFGRGGNITFSVFGGSGSATVDPNSGLIIPVQAGTITLTASSVGDVDYNPATTNQLISIYPATPTLTITSANATVVDGALQASLTTTASQDIGTLSYAITNGDTGSALVDGNGLLTAISAGQVTLTITSAGNTNYNSASVSQNISIGQATPTLTITSANEMVFDTTMTALVNTTASFGRGGNITFSVFGGSGSATVDPNSGLITPVQAGTITLTASSAGDADYNPATTNQLISIYPATPTLTITSANATVVDGALQASLTTTASQDIGTLSYSILNNTGSALVNSSGVVRAVQHGIVFLKITSSGNTNYNSATTSQAITINKSTPTLTITSSNIIPVGGTLTATVLSTATYNRGGAKAFAIVSGSGSATVNPSTGYIQAVSAGTVTLTVVTSGDADYYTASTSQLITIGKTTPTLTITSSSALVVGNTLTVMASTTAGVGNGGAMAFALIGGSGSATINSSTGLMTAINAGAVTVMVSTAGDINYNASSTSQLITISKATPTLNITSGNTMSVDGSLSATATTTATGGRGGAFSYSIGVGSGSATVNSSTGRIRAIDAGTVTLLVSTSGDANYNAASTSQIITINKVTPTLTITSGNAVSGTLSATVTTTATGGRGGAITFAIVTGSGSATVNPNTGYIQAISAGTVTLVVSSAGDADYNPATSNQLLSVGKNTQILTITSANTLAVDGVLTASVTTTAGDGGGTITYSVINGTGSIVVNSSTGVIRAVQVGTVTLKATSSGNTNYASANTTQVFTITKGTPTLSITSASTMMVSSTLTATVVTTATYGRGGSKTFSIVGGSGSATVNASTGLIQSISSGTVTLTVVTAGDANYYSATASQLITIGGGMLMVKPVNKVPVDNPLPPEKGGTVFDPTDDPMVAEEDIVISQVLSPNGDGLNDVLDVKHIEKYSNNELVIADRRGEAVFKAHGYNNDTIVFAGLSDTGVQLEDGIYYYTLVWYDHGSMNRKLGYFKLKRQ